MELVQPGQAVCALRFFYRVTLDRGDIVPDIPYPRGQKKLPTVLSGEEVARLLAAVESRKHRAVLSTIYAAGLRLSEALALKVTDIDSDLMVITVRQGKGQKDRTVMLSPQLLEVLRSYARHVRPRDWLFPGRRAGQPLHATAVQRGCVKARVAAGLGEAPLCVTGPVYPGRTWSAADFAVGPCSARRWSSRS